MNIMKAIEIKITSLKTKITLLALSWVVLILALVFTFKI